MSQPIHILLIEDDEEDYMITRDIIDEIPDRRYRLDWVSSFEEGIATIGNKNYDVYLLDYRLGKEDGLELLRQVDASSMESPFILLTGQDDIALDKEAMEAGAADFLVKGDITANVLERTIRYSIQQRKTILQLKKSEDRLKEAQAIGKIGNFEWNIPENKIYWSEELYRIFGQNPATFELTLDNYFDQIHPDDREMMQSKLDQMQKEKQGFSYGYRVIHPNQEVRYVYGSRDIELDKHGKVIRIFGTIRDVTAQKLREEELRLKDTAISTSPLPIAFADMDNKLTFVNQAFLELWGYKEASEILGQPTFDFGKDPVRVKEIMQAIQTTGQWVGEDIARKKDGTPFNVYISTSLVKDETGTPICSLATFLDITEQKKAQAYNRDISQIVEESLNEIFIFAADSLKFIQVNQGGRQNLGYPQEALTQMTPVDIKPEFTKKKFLKTIQPLLEGEKEKLIFYTIHERKDKTTYPVEVHLQYATLGGQAVFVAFIGDITEQRKSEETIKKEKETAQMYLDIAGSLVVVIDKNEQITLLNQRGEEILGVKEEKVLGKNWFDRFVPKSERKKVRQVFDRLMDKKEKNVGYYENSILNNKGEKRLIWWHNRVLLDEKGIAQGTISSGVDITELRQTEERLQASEAKAKILFDYSAIIIWEEDFSAVKLEFDKLKKKGITDYRTYFTKNLDEVKRLADLVQITQVNQESLTFYKVDTKEALITCLSDWFVEESWEVFIEELITLAEGKSDFEGEIPVITPKGEHNLLYIRLSVPPQYMDSLEVVLVSFVDITELKKNETLLKESEQRIKNYSLELEQKVKERTAELEESQLKLSNAQAIAKIGHWDFVLDTKELIFSKGMYNIYGLDEDDVISQELVEPLTHPEDREMVRVEIAKAIENNKNIFINHRIITPAGELKYVRSNVRAALLDGTSKRTRVFGVLKDITSLKESELQLQEALNKERELGILKSRFVSMASHEFRTPLSSILSSAELLGMYIETGKTDKMSRNISRIKNSVRNLTGILNDFLSLEKLEAGKVEVQKSNILLTDYLEELSEEIKPILRPNQQLLLQFKSIKIVQTDPYLLKNILINLVSNAVKYSPKGEDVTLEITKAKQQIVFKIIDRGIGIPDEDQQHMFTRFFRASNVENIKGTGLGLTIVKRYLNLLGGDIGFESKYGKGSTFYFNIPT